MAMESTASRTKSLQLTEKKTPARSDPHVALIIVVCFYQCYRLTPFKRGDPACQRHGKG